ncbi:MAG: hypothetical protein LBD98_03180 [Endomicrobium sp.]|jgi:hypothetical protein|nr:hypothetical protein [Endomicrobium sp.]
MKKILVLAVMCMVLTGCNNNFSNYVSRQKRYAEEERDLIIKLEDARTEAEKSFYLKKIKETNALIRNLNNHYR